MAVASKCCLHILCILLLYLLFFFFASLCWWHCSNYFIFLVETKPVIYFEVCFLTSTFSVWQTASFKLLVCRWLQNIQWTINWPSMIRGWWNQYYLQNPAKFGKQFKPGNKCGSFLLVVFFFPCMCSKGLRSRKWNCYGMSKNETCNWIWSLASKKSSFVQLKVVPLSSA